MSCDYDYKDKKKCVTDYTYSSSSSHVIFMNDTDTHKVILQSHTQCHLRHCGCTQCFTDDKVREMRLL